MIQRIKQLPLGIADFKRIRRENYYYVDKTMYLPKIEFSGSYLFFVRPRRFGKSLFLSMMECYYDCKQADQFDELFAGLWIHEHPTELRNSFQILRFDFSLVGADNIDELKEKFNTYCCMELQAFAEKYSDLYDNGFVDGMKACKDLTAKLNYLHINAQKKGFRLYLIVDEYDNFTNMVLAQHGKDVYRSLTHGTGFYREVFKIFKPMFWRSMMFGVSPVALDDLTSGYNIATNISMRYHYNMMMGLSEDEVREMLSYYKDNGMIHGDTEQMIQEMKPWYDNYCFSRESLNRDPKMFNVVMVMYYLQSQIEYGHAPEQLLAPNTGTDYKKMKMLLQLDQLSGNRRSAIHDIVGNGYIFNDLMEQFPADRLIEEQNFISLLYYFGMLTISGKRGLKTKLSIPNNNVRVQLYNYLLEEYQRIHLIDVEELSNAFDNATYDGNWRPMLQFIADAYEENSSVRSLIEGERNLQGFFTAFLSLSPYALVAPEVELNHGYCDFFLLPDFRKADDQRHCYIVELKYLKANDSEALAQQQWSEAKQQLKQYGQGTKVRLLAGHTQLHLIAMQFRHHHLVRMEEVAP